MDAENLPPWSKHHEETETEVKVKYDWFLRGPKGAEFILYKEKHHTDDHIRAAKVWLYTNHDVVRLSIQKVKSNAKAA